MKFFKIIIQLLFALIIIFPGISFADNLLSIKSKDKKIIIKLEKNEFTLSWKHSVEKTEWKESYKVEESGAIALVSAKFSSAGAGLPDRLDGNEVLTVKDGKFLLEGKKMILDEMSINLDGNSHHFLCVSGKKIIDLNDIFGEGIVLLKVTTNYNREE